MRAQVPAPDCSISVAAEADRRALEARLRSAIRELETRFGVSVSTALAPDGSGRRGPSWPLTAGAKIPPFGSSAHQAQLDSRSFGPGGPLLLSVLPAGAIPLESLQDELAYLELISREEPFLKGAGADVAAEVA